MPLGRHGPILCTCLNDCIICLLFWEAQIAISLGFDKELLHFLERCGVGHFLCFCGCRKCKYFLLHLICQNAPKLILMAPAPYGPSGGGSLVSLLFLAGLKKKFIVLVGVQIITIF